MFGRLNDGTGTDEAAWEGLAPKTIENRTTAYALFLGFIAREAPELLHQRPEQRFTPAIVRRYVESMQPLCTDTTISIALQRLYWCVSAANPDGDFKWIRNLASRIGRRAVPLSKPYVLSVDLYRVGLTIMSEIDKKVSDYGILTASIAEKYQDGLMICFLTEAPMRLNGFAHLCLGENLLKIAGHWRVYLAPELVKTRSAEDFTISPYLSAHIDRYMETYRPQFPDSSTQQRFWLQGDHPMSKKGISERLRKNTRLRLGFAITPNGFRRAAAASFAISDPNNAMTAKDLLHHTNFSMTERHYVRGAKTRRAAQVLADVIHGRVRVSAGLLK